MNNEYENMKKDLDEDWTVGEPNFHSNQTSGIVVNNAEVPKTPIGDPPVQMNGEDWSMKATTSEEHISKPPEQINSEQFVDAPITNPLSDGKPASGKNQDKWQMPEPVFRVSSGKKVNKSTLAETRPNLPTNPPEVSEVTNSTTNIQPQPYISEEFSFSDAAAIEETPAEVKNGVGRMIFIVVGILAMVLFAIAFLVGVYFLFFHQPEIQ